MVGSEEILCVKSRIETLVRSRECWVQTRSKVERGKDPNEHGHGHSWTSGGVTWSSICKRPPSKAGL
jgi:hypothetical protein